MHTLSKSKLLTYRQCPKRLWMEYHHPERRKDSAAAEARLVVGHQVGEIARHIYGDTNERNEIDMQTEGLEPALARTQSLLQSDEPIFEAGFLAEGALAFADVMLPVTKECGKAWRIIEVKSTTAIKDYHRDDISIQYFIARSAGVPLEAIAIAHIDSNWVYEGNGDYQGFLVEKDLTDYAAGQARAVQSWIRDAQIIAQKLDAPEISTGKQCKTPYECGFQAYCNSQEPQAVQPIRWLPGKMGSALAKHIKTHNLLELKDLPDNLLNERQKRVKAASVSGQPYFDKPGAMLALANYSLPAYFMDFETIQFAVPIWKGTRPYQLIPFQFSVQCLTSAYSLEEEKPFIDLSGNDPGVAFAEALIAACGESGPVFVYNSGFETARIRELAERFPSLAKALLALNARVVDLLPVAREYYYHPAQQGSWSIKAVLPSLCPDLRYDNLDGVQDGGMAMEAYYEAIAPQTSEARKAAIKRQLLAYCSLDTYAMVRVWSEFSGKPLKN